MRLKLNILLITLLALFSCAKESGERGSDDQGTGTLYVRFDIPANAGVTKVDGGSGGGIDGTHNVLEKDNIIRHGRLFLVDKVGNVVAYRKAEDNKNGIIGNSSGTEVITGIKRGDYKLYVFVNGSKEQAEILDKAYLNTPVGSELKINDLLNTKLSGKDLEGGKSPTFADAEGIPCTFVTDVAITAGNNYVDAHLERCVGRLTIEVLNNIPDSDRKLAIRSIGLSADNPTNGYYFPSSSAVTKGAFPDLTETIVFAPNENKTIFDHYVYETDVLSEGLTFDLFGAVYGDNATIGTDFRYSYDISGDIVNNTDHPTEGGLYFLHSASSKYYIGDLDGTLGCREFSDDEKLKNSKDIKKFLWKAIGSSTVAFQNEETKNYITLGQTSVGVGGVGTKETAFTLVRNAAGYSFYRRIPSYSRNYYYLTYNPSLHNLSSVKGASDYSKWILRQATGNGSKEDYFVDSEVEISRKERRQIKIVDKYGDAQLLQQIKRNEHVTVSINIFYNRELGEFDFKVSSWKEVSNETTFD